MARPAVLVAAGILLSRVLGLVRNRVFAHYLGTSDAADAFNAAFKIPNILQNLFGEGVLSASFIPVYARLLGQGDIAGARRVAEAVLGLLALITSVLVLLGVAVTPLLIDLIAPGFDGEKRQLTITLVRILFPGTGLLVLSAWCLGVLNSHRRFFLSYAAPVLWNLTIIGALLASHRADGQARLAIVAAWASVAGSALQLLIQLPVVWRLLGSLRPRLTRTAAPVQQVLRNFGPVFIGRGVVQISAYIDTVLASLLPTGAVAAISYAQVLYTLPVSLFGMSVSAAELPAMASAAGDDSARADYLRDRLRAGLRQIAYFVVPSAVLFLALGDVVAALLYQSGEFTRDTTIYVWAILAGSAVGLLASTLGRLYASTYYALHDTRTPLRFALVRVLAAITLGAVAALALPPLVGLDRRWGAAGLTLAASVAAWIELLLLRRGLRARIGIVALPGAYLARLWGCALVAAAAGWGAKVAVPSSHPMLVGLFSLAAYGLTYLLLTAAAAIPEAQGLIGKLRRRGAR